MAKGIQRNIYINLALNCDSSVSVTDVRMLPGDENSRGDLGLAPATFNP